MYPATLQRLKDFGAAIGPDAVGYALEGKAASVQPNGRSQVETQRALSMVEGMLFWGNDFQVLAPVVVGIAVPVMNVFVSTQLPAKMSLHDQPMFIDLAPIGEGDDSVAFYALFPGGVSRAAAFPAVKNRSAESFGQVGHNVCALLKPNAAVAAGKFNEGGRHVW